MTGKKASSASVADERHFRQSVQREKLVEHLFTGMLLRHFWRTNMNVDLLRPEVDRLGYDIVVTHGRITRHIQLKASIAGGKANAQTISAGLAQHPERLRHLDRGRQGLGVPVDALVRRQARAAAA